MNYIEKAQFQVREILEKQFAAEFETDAEDFLVEVPADRSHGDFAANIAMVSAKVLRKSPRMIAEKLLENANLEGTLFEKAEVAGAGFINFFLGKEFYAEILKNIAAEKDNYGQTQLGAGKRILVEFVSANPTGPMHIGNARGGAIGDVLASVYEKAGYYVEREFYINDAGNQIDKFAVSLDARYMQLYQPNFQIPEDAYLGDDIIEHTKNFAKINGDKFVNEPPDIRRKALVEYALPLNISSLKTDLEKYRITYNTWFKESSLHENNAARDIVKLLTQKGFTYEQDGAIWLKAEQFGADKDFVLIRSNGHMTYVVPDIAYHHDKLVTRGFDKAVNVWGADHHGYVARLKAALTACGDDAEKLDVVLMQMVRLVRDGETVKLSKRSGKAITLVTLLDEIPIDAARFFFNLRDPNSQFEFDLDLAIEQSSQNPVYYVQYAHARICSLLAQLNADGFFAVYENLSLLDAPQEIALIRHLAAFPSEIDGVAKTNSPSKITRYALETASLFHKFYDACSVKNADGEDLKLARLALCETAKIVLKNSLDLLKVEAPVKM